MVASANSDCYDPREKGVGNDNGNSSGDGAQSADIATTVNYSVVCCLGVAGPVDNSLNHGTVLISQRAYLNGLNGKGILRELIHHPLCDRDRDLRFVFEACVIINDFEAQGYGCCLALSMDNHSTEVKRLDNADNNGNGNGNDNSLGEAPPATIPTGPKFCVGAGTGFGSCYLVPTSTDVSGNTNHLCFPSEFGQAEFAPNTSNRNRNETENDQVTIWNYLLEQKRKAGDTQPRVSVEDVVSGIGLANAYSCFAALHPQSVHPEVQEQFRCSGDLRGKVVGDNMHRCEVCKRAVETVLVAYGTAVGSCAMSFLPTGGLYITGGLMRNLFDKNDPSWRGLEEVPTRKRNDDESPPSPSAGLAPAPSPLSLFLEAYRCKGAASFLLDNIPLYAVLAKDAGLRGAAIRAEMVCMRLLSWFRCSILGYRELSICNTALLNLTRSNINVFLVRFLSFLHAGAPDVA
eukprot:jgi/Psemu1/223779/e_gw1.1380.1.1